MKLLIVLTLTLHSLAAMSATKFFSKSFTAETEEQLVADAETSIPVLINGGDRSMNQSYQFEGCWHNNSRTIKVGHLSVSKHYAPDQSGKMNPFFRGSLQLIHSGCRRDR